MEEKLALPLRRRAFVVAASGRYERTVRAPAHGARSAVLTPPPPCARSPLAQHSPSKGPTACVGDVRGERAAFGKVTERRPPPRGWRRKSTW